MRTGKFLAISALATTLLLMVSLMAVLMGSADVAIAILKCLAMTYGIGLSAGLTWAIVGILTYRGDKNV